MDAHVCGICEGYMYVVSADLWTYVHTCGGQVASSTTLHHMPLQQGLSLKLEIAEYQEASVNLVPVPFPTVVEVVIYSCTWDFPWLLKIRT